MSCNLIDLDSSKYLQGLDNMQGCKYIQDIWIASWKKYQGLVKDSCLACIQMEFLLQVWSINDVQFTSQTAKDFLIKRFGEYIRQLLISAKMLKINVPFSNMISNEMMTNFNMLSSRMLHGIVSNLNNTFIVTKQWNMFHMYPIIFKSLGHPKKLSTTWTNGNVFRFGSG